MRLSPDLTRRGFVGAVASAGILTGLSCTDRAKFSPNGVASLADRLIEDKRAPGLVIAHGKASEPTHFLTRGTIAFDSKTPVDQNTLWRIYSMTKPMTGMAAMILISEGRLALDQPVSDFIPAFQKIKVSVDGSGLQALPARTPVTVRHLLTHTSGLIYGEFTESPIADAYRKLGIFGLQTKQGENLEAAPSLAEFADRAATIPLVCEPGANWVYGVGLDVLGRVIEVASGEPFDRFLQRRLIDPLGMTSTFFTVPEALKDRLSPSYERGVFSVHVLDPAASSIYLEAPPIPYGGSGLVSSARDYDRFLAMIGNRGMLDGQEIMRPDAVAMGVSNLAPAGVNLAELRMTTGDPSEGQGAGASIVLDGVAAGTFGWAGMAGTVGRVNVKTGLRYSGFLNVVGETRLMNDLGPAVQREFA